MTSPMPRDSLGRIVWLGDVTDKGLRVGAFSGDWLLLSFGYIVYRLPANMVTVDLGASPERTNYERYFSDLGTREDVGNAIDDICDEYASCIMCVFEGWEMSGEMGDCHDFEIWLDEKAVV